jgi:hypothetical protein
MIIDIKNDEYLPEGRYVLWNMDKIERVKSSLPANSGERAILIEYDKIGGLITKDDEKLPLHRLWDIEKARIVGSVEELSDDQIDDILRKGENANIPGSRYRKAKTESEIRHRKKIENSLKEPRVSVGILNQGKNNRFINNTFEGLDVGIQDEGENTVARGNQFIGFSQDAGKFFNKHPWWSAIIAGLLVSVLWYSVQIFL